MFNEMHLVEHTVNSVTIIFVSTTRPALEELLVYPTRVDFLTCSDGAGCDESFNELTVYPLALLTDGGIPPLWLIFSV